MTPTEQYIHDRDEQVKKNLEDRDLSIHAFRYHEQLARTNYVKNFCWAGVPILQLPTDLMVMQELIDKIKPQYIIECGVAFGGMTAFYSDMLHSTGACFNSRVIAIDKKFHSHTKDSLFYYRSLRGLSRWAEGKVSMFESDSISPKLHRRISKMVKGQRVLVSLDSNHTHDHVLQELRLYSPLVSVGSYIVVFDTAIETFAHLIEKDRPWGKGNNPWTAVQTFMEGNEEFIVDREVEQRAGLTAAPGGWLRRIKEAKCK
jgi:cephalosporin hydroxylase